MLIGANLCLALIVVAQPPDREAIRTRLKQTWEAVGTLEARGEEFPCDREGHREVGGTYRRFEFKWSAGGSRVMKLYSVAPGGEKTSLIWFHQDGRKTYLMRPFAGDPDSIDSVSIRNQTDTAEELRTAMLAFLWMWTPRGAPLYTYIDEKSMLESGRGEGGQDVVILKSESHGIPLRFVLDPAHDYLPLEIHIADFGIKKTTRFQNEGGIWFPVEGSETEFSEGRSTYRGGFMVEELHVNRPLPESTFGMPRLGAGVLVLDDTTGNNIIKGSADARRRLEAKHSRPRPSSDPMPPVNVASRGPGPNWGPLLIAGASSVVLLTALYLRYFRSRS